MPNDLASLGIRVDSAEVPRAADELDKLTQSAGNAEKAVEKVGPAFEAAAAGAEKNSGAVGTAAQVYEQLGGSAKKSIGTVAEAAKQSTPQVNALSSAVEDNARAFNALREELGLAELQKGLDNLAAKQSAFAEEAAAARLAVIGIGAAVAGSIAAVYVLGKAYKEAQEESFALNKAIILSGNVAGVTADQLGVMAEALSDIAGTRADAAAALALLVSTGQVASKNLEDFAGIAVQFERTVGQPIAQTVKIFEELGRKPVAASLRLQEQYHYLTAAVVAQMKALEDSGRAQEAGELAQQQFARASSERLAEVEEKLGFIERATRATTTSFGKMWDAILDVGRPDVLDDKLAGLEERIRQLQDLQSRFPQAVAGGLFTDRARNLAALQQERSNLQALRKEQEGEAAARSAAARKEDAAIAAAAEAERAQQAQREAARKSGDSRFGLDLARIRRELGEVSAAYANYEDTLEAERQAGLINERDYYNERRAIIEESTTAEIQSLQDQNRRIAADSARLRQQALEDAKRAKTSSERVKAESSANDEITANQRTILENESKISVLRDKAIAQVQVIGTEQKAANNALAQSYEDARAAAQSYLDVLVQQQERDFDSLGKGRRRREFDEGRNRIDDAFAQQRLQLESDRRTGPQTEDARQRYDQELALITEFHQKAIASYDRYWIALSAKQNSFFAGAAEAFANYVDGANNFAAMTENVITDALEGGEDAVIRFAMTGKSSFKDLADSIIEDILRIQLRAALAQVMGGSNWLGALFGAAFGSVGGTGAGGGAPPSNSGVLFADVGVRRVPRDNQLAILHKDEAVVPAGMNPFAGGRGLGGNSVNVNSTLNVEAGVSAAQFQAALDQRDALLERQIAENLSRKRWDAFLS